MQLDHNTAVRSIIIHQNERIINCTRIWAFFICARQLMISFPPHTTMWVQLIYLSPLNTYYTRYSLQHMKDVLDWLETHRMDRSLMITTCQWLRYANDYAHANTVSKRLPPNCSTLSIKRGYKELASISALRDFGLYVTSSASGWSPPNTRGVCTDVGLGHDFWSEGK